MSVKKLEKFRNLSALDLGLNQVSQQVKVSTDLEGAVRHFAHESQANYLVVDLVTARRYAASLLTKRFVILTGLSGSGKTKLAHAFAAWIAESDAQYRVVAVGADWTTNENLLG